MIQRVLEQAEEEFGRSAAYYESRESGLGIRFRDEVAAVVDWILGHPEIPRLRKRGYRRVNLRVFPHFVAYVIRGNTLCGLSRLRMPTGDRSIG
jgi:hypothetical protein